MLLKRGVWVVLIFAVALFFLCYRPEPPHYDLYGAQPGQPLPGLSLREHHIFNKGLTLFQKDFEPEEGLGPLFNGRSCFECHGKPTAVGLEGKDVSTTGVVRIGMIVPDSPLAKDLKKAKEQADLYDFTGLIDKGGPAMQRKSITQEFPGKYPPEVNVEVGVVPPQAQFISLRHSPPVLGLGLMDAISDQTILSNMFKEAKAAPDLVGRTNPLADPLTRATRIGRFGWKDQQPDLLLFTAEAMNAEMGITTFIQNAPKTATGIVDLPKALAPYLPPEPNDMGENLVQLAAFQALLAPPSKPVLNAQSRHGKEIFTKLQCAVCHTPELSTAPIVEIPDPSSPFPDLHYMEVKSLENQPVRLYSDLLLHSMGPLLADGIVQGTARGGEWRTTPLWGLRYKKFYLHDGRARTLDKAILAHGGQAESTTRAYRALPDTDRQDLLSFLKALLMNAIKELWKPLDEPAGPISGLVRGLAWTLLGVDALLVVLHLLFYQWHLVPMDFVKELFDLGAEANVPTWYASILWFMVALAAVLCFWAERRAAVKTWTLKMWWVIALVFTVASVDDTATIHENMGSLLAELTRHSSFSSALSAGSENSPWILFYAPPLVLFLSACIMFLWRRFEGNNRLKFLLIAAVECYIIAVGCDYYQGLPESRQYALAGMFDANREPFVNATIVVEETLENIGTSLLVIVLAAHANRVLARREPRANDSTLPI